MGYRRLDTLLDCSIHGFNIRVACRMCGRWRVMSSSELFWLYRKKGWSDEVERVAEHLRCAGCARGGTWIEIKLVDREQQTDIMPARPKVRLTAIEGGRKGKE